MKNSFPSFIKKNLLILQMQRQIQKLTLKYPCRCRD